MKWFYASEGRQLGPIEETELDALAQARIINPDSLVWSDGMPTWDRYDAVRAPAGPAAITTINNQIRSCSGCGHQFTTSAMIPFGDSWVCAACKPGYLQRLREGVLVPGMLNYAGFWIRTGAYMIDAVILSVFNMIVSLVALPFILGSYSRGTGANFRSMLMVQGVVALVEVIIAAGYQGYFLGSKGATPGKMVLKLKVVRSDGSKLTFGRGVGRYFSYWISSFTMLIGFIMIGFDDEKRALHDRVCDTRVIVGG